MQIIVSQEFHVNESVETGHYKADLFMFWEANKKAGLTDGQIIMLLKHGHGSMGDAAITDPVTQRLINFMGRLSWNSKHHGLQMALYA